MLTPLRKPSHAIRIVEKFLKEAAESFQTASVKEAFERKNPASVAPNTLGENKGGKPRAAKASVSR
jgi:hypothetical protein